MMNRKRDENEKGKGRKEGRKKERKEGRKEERKIIILNPLKKQKTDRLFTRTSRKHCTNEVFLTVFVKEVRVFRSCNLCFVLKKKKKKKKRKKRKKKKRKKKKKR